MRYQKVIKTDGVETARYDYVYSEGTLVLITYTADGVSDIARFIYDSYGEPRGFILNNTAAYLYVKNAQGDITGIVNENGEVILTCTYDAWGNVNFGSTSMTHMTLAAKLSQINPFTYRGYCYDYDIGMYYLQSRYYDPEIGRFINADSTDYLGATGTLLSYNLFAYCENDGVNCLDATGTWGKEVHYNDTRKWAKKVGYNDAESKILAKSNQGMDNITTHAMFIWNQHIHFNTNINKGPDSRMIFATIRMTLACALWEMNCSSYLENLEKAKTQYSGYKLHEQERKLFVEFNNNKGYCIELVGQGLHSIQDIEGHGQTEPTIEVFGLSLTQHLVSSGNKKKHKSDNVWYSWTNSHKTHLFFDITKERYYHTQQDSLRYLRTFFNFRKKLYEQKYKDKFTKKEYQFNGYIVK